MEQTAEQKTVGISEKRAKEIKISKQIAERIKGQWDELAKRQKNSGVRLRANRKITSITFARDHQGKIAVKVNLRNGRSITDNSQEKAIDTFKKQSRQDYARAKIAELLKRIREDGYAAVEGDIPAELKEAVLSAMSKANISTSYRGRKVEAAEARQASQRAAQAADNAMKNAMGSDGSTNKAGYLSAGLLFTAGTLACTNPPKGYASYTLPTTKAVEDAFQKGYLTLTGKEIPATFSKPVQQAMVRTLSANLTFTASALTDFNEGPLKNEIFTQVTGHPREGKPGSATLTETIRKSDGTEFSVSRSGDYHQSRTNATTTALAAEMLFSKEDDLSPAMKQTTAELNRKAEKYITENGGSPEELKTLPFEELVYKYPKLPNLFGTVSFKPLEKEAAEGYSYSPRMAELIRHFSEARRLDKEENNRTNRENQGKQISQTLGLDPKQLSDEIDPLRKALAEAGFTKENINLPESKESLDTFCRKNRKLFIQGDGGIYFSCSKDDIDALHQKQKEVKQQKKSSQYTAALARVSGKQPEELSDAEQKYARRLEESKVNPGALWGIVKEKLPPAEGLGKIGALLDEAKARQEKEAAGNQTDNGRTVQDSSEKPAQPQVRSIAEKKMAIEKNKEETRKAPAPVQEPAVKAAVPAQDEAKRVADKMKAAIDKQQKKETPQAQKEPQKQGSLQQQLSATEKQIAKQPASPQMTAAQIALKKKGQDFGR